MPDNQPVQPTVVNNSASSTNTILIVIVLVLIVGFGVWWYKTYRSAPAPTGPNGALQINVQGGQTPPATNPGTPQTQ